MFFEFLKIVLSITTLITAILNIREKYNRIETRYVITVTFLYIILYIIFTYYFIFIQLDIYFKKVEKV